MCLSGETGAKNLLLIFQLWYEIIHAGVNIAKFKDEVFEVVQVYFPVVYNPAPEDMKDGVSNEDLVLAIRKVNCVPVCVLDHNL